MRLKKFISALPLFLVLTTVNAQDRSMLLQQYRRGPALNAYFKKVHFELEAYTVLGKIQAFKIKPKMDYAFGARVQYRFVKTFGVTAGINVLNIQYKNEFENDSIDRISSIDRIRYLAFPVSLRMLMGDFFNIEAGGHLNYPISAYNTTFPENEPSLKIPYEEGTYRTSLGMFVGIQIKVFGPINLAVQYRFAKRFKETIGTKSNNTAALMMGIQYFITALNKTKTTQKGLGFKKRR